MALVQFRGLSGAGIVSDPNPAELGLNAWSSGANVRFHANKAERAPVLKTAVPLTAAPSYVFSYRPASLNDMIISVSTSAITHVSSGDAVDLTPEAGASYSPGAAFTSTALGDVTYLNQPSAVPLYFGPQSGRFETLPGWDPSWSCRSLRNYGDYMIALGVTKGAQSVPQMFKWSDLTLAGQPPGSWDANDATTNAGENVIEDLTSPIVDGCALKDAFVVYASDQAILVTQTGDQLVFAFTRLGIDGGLIAPNCVVEVAGGHYCFGTSDIYFHDGTTQRSICDGVSRDFIFGTLNRKLAEACFTIYSPVHKEILFCYATTDPAAPWSGLGCNRAAVYSLTSQTWSYLDLPNVCSGSLVSVDQSPTYARYDSDGPTYATTSDTYLGLDGSHSDNVIFGSASTGTISESRVLAYDFANKGSLPNLAIEADCNSSAYLQRIGLDLDTQGSDLATYKNVRRVYPQSVMYAETPVTITLGGSNTPAGPLKWAAPVTFDPTTQYKVDTLIGGRYLSYRFEVDAPVDFEVVGFDADVVSAGRR
ncbi:hypothetical protein C0V97_12505 [Asaia sp. W19]|uniref:hypothetical protein n=1 Tax=unclassified Asaia TaxID=2685023 RepID=UPI000F8E8E17|nr:hypothetical protein [Asaia sp. W19]RUT24159.1 hypothetical protein C0V97_18060 [Asaia sp. W19]RUT25397.1 hypothetical protein C0V97_12505 [Asaia sp. W19]